LEKIIHFDNPFLKIFVSAQAVDNLVEGNSEKEKSEVQVELQRILVYHSFIMTFTTG